VTTRRRKQAAPIERPEIEVVTGPERFTVARFLSDCCDETYQYLRGEWREGNQLMARRVPVDALPAVVILARFGRDFDVAVVDDYDALIERYRDHIKECYHPDKFLASVIAMQHETGHFPGPEVYDDLKIERIYEELIENVQ